jgi:hypothetical protein
MNGRNGETIWDIPLLRTAKRVRQFHLHIGGSTLSRAETPCSMDDAKPDEEPPARRRVRCWLDWINLNKRTESRRLSLTFTANSSASAGW